DIVSGASLSDLVAKRDAAIDADVKLRLQETMAAMTVMVKTAEQGMAYDQMLAEGNAKGNQIIQATVDGLIAQTKSFETAMGVLQLSLPQFEGSDSLDNPSAVALQ
ncbi:MAG: imelysin family protein, partial [Alphaproteobacteria bacterium]|nr:imelysin family protein [Alphaproteobacteria bacterium]